MSELDLENAFASLAALRAEHRRLQKLYRDDRTNVFEQIESFIRRGRTTGAILDEEGDQAAAQSLLDFWATTLYRADRPVPESTLLAFDAALAPTLDEGVVPYVGLDPFAEQKKDLFFGRVRAVDNLVRRLQQENLIAVIGPSGSGKSSLVLAGLLPALKSGALPGSDGWAYLGRMVPGSDALGGLVRLLGRHAGDVVRVSNELERLRKEPGSLVTLVERLFPSQPTVLVIDQFEELSTLSEDAASRAAFENALAHLVSGGSVRHLVILTMRSDFIGAVALQPALQQILETALEHATPLTAAELREAIERPAQQIGLKFEQGVVEALVHDILGEPAALPLLQFTLLKLWERRQHNLVTMEAYRELGGGRLALTQTADKFMARLIPQDRVVADRIFLRLVRPGTGQDNVSSRVRRRTLYRIGPEEHVDRVLDKLIAERLIRLTGETEGDTEVEVAHEALVRNWLYLVKLLESEREQQKTRIRLESKAAEWVRLGRGEAGLLKSLALIEAEGWLQSPESEALAGDDLRALVAASRRAADHAESRQRRAQLMLASLTCAAFVFASFALWGMLEARRSGQEATRFSADVVQLTEASRDEAVWRQQEAEKEAIELQVQADRIQQQSDQLAEKDRLLIQRQQQNLRLSNAEKESALLKGRLYDADGLTRSAREALADDPERATLLALQGALLLAAYDQEIPTNVQAELYQAVHANRLRITVPSSSGEAALAFSADGRRLATGGGGRPLRIWDAISGHQLLALPGTSATVAAFSWDNRLLAIVGDAGNVQIFNPATGSLIRTLPDRVGGLERLTFSPDGRFLAGVGSDQKVLLWNVEGNDPSRPLRAAEQAPDGVIRAAAFSPTGAFLATGGSDNVVRLWASDSGELLATMRGHQQRINDLAFHPDGRRLLSASDDRSIRMWVVAPDSGRDADFEIGRLQLTGQPEAINVMSDGSGLLAVGADATVTAIEIVPETRTIGSVRSRGVRLSTSDRFTLAAPDATSFRVSPDGTMLATGADSLDVRIWDVEPGSGVILGASPEPIARLASTADGAFLTSGSNGLVLAWDLTRAGGELVSAFDTPGGPLVAFSPDGTRAAVPSCAAGSCRIGIYSVASQRLERTIAGSGTISSLVFSADGSILLAVSTASASGQFWEVSTGRELDTSLPLAKDISALAFSPDNSRLAVARGDGTLQIWGWDGATLLPGETFRAPARVSGLAFARDGSTLATAGADRIVRVWRLGSDGAPPTPRLLSGHTGTIRSLAFSADGRFLVTGGDDRTARVWDLRAAGPSLLTIPVGPSAVSGVAFTRDSTGVIVAIEDGTLRWFPVPDASLVPWALTTLTRAFRPDECSALCDRLPAAVNSIVEANRLAMLGDERGAIAKYESARQIAPMLGIRSEWQARWLASQTRARGLRQDTRGTLAQVEKLAVANDIDDARVLAARLPPVATFGGNTDRLAETGRSGLVSAFRSLAQMKARSGQRADTRRFLSSANDADPSQKIDIDAETAKLMRDSDKDQAVLLMNSGKIKEAVDLLRELRGAGVNDTLFDRDDETANTLCWRGSLGLLELAKDPEVRKACERAIELTKGANTGHLDSRGLNRARNGEVKTAIEDFRAFARDPNHRAETRSDRERWIALLEKGGDPFTSAVLQDLR